MAKLIRRGEYWRRYWRGVSSLGGVETAKDDLVSVDLLKGQDQGIIVVGLNRPKAKNAINNRLATALDGILTGVKFDKSARVLILRSLVPSVFCAGADLKERAGLTEIETEIFVNKLRRLMSKVEDLPVPVISAIDGVALGGGLEMALASDIRVASREARLGLVETKLAIIPGAGGTQRLPRLVGPSIAKELIFTGRVLSGAESKEMGLVNHCVESNSGGDAAFLRALEIAREIAPNGPVGVRMAKLAVNRGLQVDLASGCAIEELCYSRLLPTKDRIEGLTAFREKRAPIYTGR